MQYHARIRRHSPVDKLWRRDKRIGGTVFGVHFRIHANAFVSRPLTPQQVAKLHGHPSVEIEATAVAVSYSQDRQGSGESGPDRSSAGVDRAAETPGSTAEENSSDQAEEAEFEDGTEAATEEATSAEASFAPLRRPRGRPRKNP